jgi:hypothetical protein
MILNSLFRGTIVIICLLHLILYSLILLGLYNQMVKGSNFVVDVSITVGLFAWWYNTQKL